MTKNERLADLEALRAALLSDRNAMTGLVHDRHRRTRRVHNHVKAIRGLLIALEHELDGLAYARSASQPDGDIYKRIARHDERIGQIGRELVTVRAEARIERLLALAAQIKALEEDTTDVPDEIIVS